eukprot:CCRYP_010876-RC/>CCRYP_010876-RC protein AED:0.16 eAED:1.00 QI:0/-1/0/1/-1/0/1/0/127
MLHLFITQRPCQVCHYSANCSPFYWQKSSPIPACHQGCLKKCPCTRRGLKASLLSSWQCCTPQNPPLPKRHRSRSSYPQGAIPALCKGNSAGFKYARFLSTFHRGTFSDSFFVGYARICGSIQRWTI